MLVLAALIGLFLLPGLLWVSQLHRADNLDWPARLVLGWAWAFAAFSLVAGPFLWLRAATSAFLTVWTWFWIVSVVLTAGLYGWTIRRGRAAATTDITKAPPVDKPAPPGGRSRSAEPSSRGGGPLAAYAAVAGGVVAWWALGARNGQHLGLTLGMPAILAVAAVLALRLRRSAASRLARDAADDVRPPRLWSVLAGAAVLAQAVGAVAYHRPDWDDCYYLAAALDYQEGELLNDQEPTHREELPVQAIYLLMTWELWGATLGRLAGPGPLVVFHSALPGLLVLACYAAYRAVLQELVPRRWVPLALLGLCGFHLWGISNLGNASNHFLIRVWQGKALLVHLVLPLTIWCLLRFARQPTWRWWFSLCACLAIGPGISSSAIFLCVMLVTCLAPLLVATAPWRTRFVVVAGAGLALLPTLGVGVLIWLAVHGDPAYQPETSLTALQSWFREWDRYAGSGSAEILWLMVLPLLWVLLADWRSRALLVGLPAVLFLTYGNPLAQSLVAGRLTGSVTYYRLFWLFPEGLGLAVAVALVSRLVSRLAVRDAGPRQDWLALGACGAALAVWSTLPGVWVWSAANNRGPFMTPQLAANPEQMPPDLKVIARTLADEPDIEEHRIACGEEVASFLTPFSRRFRFAVTRDGYTMYSVGKWHSPAEAADRLYLTNALWLGPTFPRLPEESWSLITRTAGAPPDSPRPDPWPSLQSLPTLLDRYRVDYAIASPVVGDGRDDDIHRRIQESTLRRYGFRPVHKGAAYSLWRRDRAASRALESSQPTPGAGKTP